MKRVLTVDPAHHYVVTEAEEVFGSRITLFKILGIRIEADASWLVVALLVVWSLATNVFPSYRLGAEESIYWILGMIGACGLFCSVLLHELAHAFIAVRFGLHVRSIALFIFGGVARTDEENEEPIPELVTALAGPVASVVVGFALLGIHRLSAGISAPMAVRVELSYLCLMNFALAGLNLVPAFPLDGGRIFRAVVWKATGSRIRATRVATAAGEAIAYLIIGLGAVETVRSDPLNGMWFVVLGFFLRSASRASYRQAVIADGLRNEPVARFIETDVEPVPHHTRLDSFVEEWVLRYHCDLFPVIRRGSLEGCVTARAAKRIPRNRWESCMVVDIMQPLSDAYTIAKESDAFAAIQRMRDIGLNALMVIEEGNLVGIVPGNSLLAHLRIRQKKI